MRKLVLKEILICSYKERKAKKATFHPKRTLIYGKNDTGKSSLIKTIYSTFGASPAKQNIKWKEVNATSIIRFSINDDDYTILRDNKTYCIFDSNDNLLKLFKSVTKELGPFLSDLLNFKIKLPDKNNEIIVPPPAFMFLPFYVDQDAGWTSNWNSFGNLQQLKNPREPIAYYHTGIRPNEYYDAKAEMNVYLNEMVCLEEERKITNNILQNIKEKLQSAIEFNIDIELFKEEVKELLVKCEKLKSVEEKTKQKLVELYNKKVVISAQIEITELALKEAEKDYTYAANKLNHLVECPTCGAGYDNSFADRFELAQDSDRCKDLLCELFVDSQKCQGEIDAQNNALTKTISEIEELEAILSSKKGEVILKDVIENAGRNEIRKIFDDKIKSLTESIIENAYKKGQVEEKIRELEDKNRKATILAFYETKMSKYLRELEVFSLAPKDYRNISGKINDTGSSLPRALTAYYFSLFETIRSFSTSMYAPLIIDSPNQQAQDPGHIEKILGFIKDHQPEGSQLILGLEELYNMNFDCPIIELKEKHSLLQADEFAAVEAEMRYYLDACHQNSGELF